MWEKRQECACGRGLMAGGEGSVVRRPLAAWSRSTVIGTGTESEGPGSQHLLIAVRFPCWANPFSKDTITHRQFALLCQASDCGALSACWGKLAESIPLSCSEHGWGAAWEAGPQVQES